MIGTWLQSRKWVGIRRDSLITFGCLSVALGLGLVSLVAFVHAISYLVVAIGWVFSGFGMGLATSSTAIAVMTLSAVTEQGRNASSLNLSDALGSALFVGVTGTLFTALSKNDHVPVFGTLLVAMSVVALMAAAASRRIGHLVDTAR